MADWQVVRFDPTYEEKIDPEILPLCDALNAAGFVTEASCCGHGRDWPRVWFEHSTDARIEQLARFVMAAEQGDGRPHFSMFQKEILPDGCRWTVEVHLNNVYADTPHALACKEAEIALSSMVASIEEWNAANPTKLEERL